MGHMSLYDTFRRALADERPVALATVVAGPSALGEKMLVYANGSSEGEIAPPELRAWIAGEGLRLLREERPDTVTHAVMEGTFEIFFDVYPVPPRLVIVGATDIGIALSRLAKGLGYRVVVTDARGTFAQQERFPDADLVLKGWPQDVLPGVPFDESTYVVLLSHDPKFDTPTLAHVLPGPAPYIGAIGSRKTQRERFERLRQEGYTEEQLARVHGPVGLDLGARSTEETALAIMAEIVAVRHGKRGGFLKDAP